MEASKSEIRVTVSSSGWADRFLTWEKRLRKLGGGLSYKGTNPIHEGSTLMTSSPPKDPTS